MHPLEAKIRWFQRRVQCWLLVDGLARLAAWLVGTAMLLGAADYWFRFQDLGLRVMMGGVFFAVAAWRGYRFVSRAIGRRLTEVGLALRLEKSFPSLADRLASSVAFLQQREPDSGSGEDPTEGSPALRALAITQTTHQVLPLDFREALDIRPLVRSVLVAGLLFLGAVGIVLLDPGAVRIALARLVMPLHPIAWPQRTHLILVPRVERIGRGDPLELEVKEKEGKLPADLRIHYRLETADGVEEHSEPIPKVVQRSETGQWEEVGQVRREGLVRPFWYRVTGGDDTTMDWVRVEVREPPSLLSCQVRLIPPEYTGLPAETAGQWIRALVGTRVEMVGRADRKLRAAVLVANEDRRYSAKILEDEQTFHIGTDLAEEAAEGQAPNTGRVRSAKQPHTGNAPQAGSERTGEKQDASDRSETPAEPSGGLFVRHSGRWRLRLVDEEGLEHEVASWEVRAVPDLPPSLTLESPPVLIYATVKAIVPIRAKVKDDLGIRRVALLASLAEPTLSRESKLPPVPRKPVSQPSEESALPGVREWVLYEGPSLPPKQAKPFSTGGDLSVSLPAVEYAWDLGSWATQAGMQILFSLQAADYAGQTGASSQHRIVLLTPEQFTEHVSAQQNALLAELGQWLQKQSSVRDQLTELNQSLVQSKKMGQRDLDRLRNLELVQRQIHTQLVSAPESIQVRLEQLSVDLENNHLGQSDFWRRLEYLRAGLVRLDKEHLAGIHQKFIFGVKVAQTALETCPAEAAVAPPQPLLDVMAQVIEHQQQVIRNVEDWLNRFRPGVQTQKFSQEVAHLIRDQKSLQEQVRRIALRTLTKELRELSSQESAELQSASQEQAELARRMENLQQEMTDTLRTLQPLDPVAAQVLGEAVRYTEQASPLSLMRAASQDIAQNQMGRLLQTLPQIVHHLEHLADLLANRQGQTFKQNLPLLEQTEQALFDLIKRQEQIHTLLESAHRQGADKAALLQQAASEQESVASRLQKILEQVEQLWAADSAQAVRAALEAMHRSVGAARQGESALAIHASQTALQSLQQARQLLADQRFQIQTALLAQHLARLREALADLHQRQQSVWKETVRLEEERKAPGTLSPQDQVRLADLARQQQELHDQIDSWREKSAETLVVQMALEETARWMQQAAQQLAQSQTGLATQQAQQEALAQIQLLLQSLAQDPFPATFPKQTPSDAQQPPASSRPQKVLSAAELKLLRLWQESVHARTQTLYQKFGDNPPDQPEVQSEYESVRQAQARLIQAVEQILRSASSEENQR